VIELDAAEVSKVPHKSDVPFLTENKQFAREDSGRTRLLRKGVAK
jgi:hypothetical protein